MEQKMKNQLLSNHDDVITLDHSFKKGKFSRPKYFSLIMCIIVVLSYFIFSFWIFQLYLKNGSLQRRVLYLMGENNDLANENYDVSTSFTSVNIAKKNVDKENEELKKQIKELNDKVNELKSNSNKFINELFRNSLQSSIITTSEEYMYLKSIYDTNKEIYLQLIYKATKDGDTIDSFHKHISTINPTLLLIEYDKGNKFGGVTTQKWNFDGKGYTYKEDKFSFLFSLSNQIKFTVVKSSEAVHVGDDFICGFNNDLVIKDHCLTGVKGYSGLPVAYGSKGDSVFDFTGNTNNEFVIKEFEVFEIKYSSN